MSRKAILGLTIAAATVFSAGAQKSEKSPRQSFDEFRKGIMNDYNEFRKTILDHYADFLDGEWHPYESLNGMKKYSEPKPEQVPTVDGYKPPRRPRQRPARSEESPAPAVPSVARPTSVPETKPEPKSAPAPVVAPEPDADVDVKPEVTVPVAVIPEKTAEPEKPAAPSLPSVDVGGDVDEFKFFEIPMSVPHIDFNIASSLTTTADYADHWRRLDSGRVAAKALPTLKKKAKELGLNDYLTFEFVKSYIDGRFPQSDESARLSTVHYLLANMGYNARIAATGKGTPLLLIPFRQNVYGRSFMMVDGRRFYVFAPEGVDIMKMSEPIYTCQLPAAADKANDFDLVINGLNLPVKPKAFDYQYGPLHLQGEVNENLMPVLYRYPQMPTEDYARSNVQPELRSNLVSQVRDQLSDRSSDAAAETLLKFMHNVFDYATDDEYHGFEKPYFLEETLYYPKNDCEDRAIFYTYFLWNSLGKEAQMIAFPGHEAASVRLDSPVSGSSYDYEGKTFFISDPTYIGSRTGMVMPSYKNDAPTVDLYYH